MRIALYDEGRLELVQDGQVHEVSAALAALPQQAHTWLGTRGDPLIANLAALKPAIVAALPGGVTKPVAEALPLIEGYAIALDMVVRGPEDRSLRKSGDSYAELDPWLVTADEVADPEVLDFFLNVSGEPRPQSNTGRMIMSIAEQIAYASRFSTLYSGNIIMTGTCKGVGPVRPGDTIRCGIDGIAEMTVAIHPTYAEAREVE